MKLTLWLSFRVPSGWCYFVSWFFTFWTGRKIRKWAHVGNACIWAHIMHHRVDACEFSNCSFHMIVGEELEIDTRIYLLHVLSKGCTNILVNILRGGRSIEEELDGCQDCWLLRQIQRFLNWIFQSFTNSRIKVILIKGSILDGLDEGLGSLQFFEGCDNVLSLLQGCAISSGLSSGGGD
jgi:hypothetical protein